MPRKAAEKGKAAEKDDMKASACCDVTAWRPKGAAPTTNVMDHQTE